MCRHHHPVSEQFHHLHRIPHAHGWFISFHPQPTTHLLSIPTSALTRRYVNMQSCNAHLCLPFPCSIKTPRFNHMVACISTSLLVITEWNSTLWIEHILSPHQLMDIVIISSAGRTGSAAMNICVQLFVWMYISIFPGERLVIGLLRCMVNLCLTFQQSVTLVSKWLDHVAGAQQCSRSPVSPSPTS